MTTRLNRLRTDLVIIACGLLYRVGNGVCRIGMAIRGWASIRRAKTLIAGTGWQTGRREL